MLVFVVCRARLPRAPGSDAITPVVAVRQHLGREPLQAVAQICNLPYRGFSTRMVSQARECDGKFARSAEYNSAIRQNAILRYDAKPTLATVPPNFTARLAAMGSGANRPSALRNARSLSESTFTNLAEIKAAISVLRLC